MRQYDIFFYLNWIEELQKHISFADKHSEKNTNIASRNMFYLVEKLHISIKNLALKQNYTF